MVYLTIIPRARVEYEMVDSLHAGYNHLTNQPDFILLNKPEKKSKKKGTSAFRMPKVASIKTVCHITNRVNKWKLIEINKLCSDQHFQKIHRILGLIFLCSTAKNRE